ncbi:hypothetical protein [Aggregatibacter actinomycetemcomitans]|uniref:hypothetical protein n=1 Tax=Aggregatibacter actinomycetemcomitans TaxID=714 RepID=UPI0011DD7FAF|nr:hypothetical protein [Aggregatibacter actinomycetemcomitans]QEH45973.1 hypothetical protein FXN58_10905 [Aggregatibacter actinomycetemcomitans]
MATVKIRFSIEIDNELLINHQIEQEKNASFRKERELAEEVINKLNTFYTGLNVHQQNWADLVVMKEQYQKHLAHQKDNTK